VFNPAGNRVAFEWTKSENENGESGNASICVINADGSGASCLPNPPSGYCKQPDWGEGGIVFQCKTGGQWQIYIARANGDGSLGRISKLTSGPGATDVSWAPNGHLIYSRSKGGGRDGADLHEIDPNAPADGTTGVPPSTFLHGRNLYSGAVVHCKDGFTYFESSNGEDVPTVVCRVPSDGAIASGGPAAPAAVPPRSRQPTVATPWLAGPGAAR
jgi:hypothetical protein